MTGTTDTIIAIKHKLRETNILCALPPNTPPILVTQHSARTVHKTGHFAPINSAISVKEAEDGIVLPGQRPVAQQRII